MEKVAGAIRAKGLPSVIMANLPSSKLPVTLSGRSVRKRVGKGDRGASSMNSRLAAFLD